jgi:hypothetical protein
MRALMIAALLLMQLSAQAAEPLAPACKGQAQDRAIR